MRLPWTLKPTVRKAKPWSTLHADAASEADILACFRLLLGRVPQVEEWRGHRMRAGEPLAGVVASYLTSLEFQRRGLLDPTGDGDIVTTEIQGFTIFTHAGDAAVGKHVVGDNYERDVTAFVRATLREGMSFVDLGANIGYFTLLAAHLVGPRGRVLAVEPNPRNVRLIEASRRLNGFGHVTVAPVAAGRETGVLVLNTSFSNGTTSDVPEEVNQLFSAEIVPSLRLDALLGDVPVDFIKIDVEGAEYNALLGGAETIRRSRPVIVSEFSPAMMPGISKISGEEYLHWLIGLGYGLSVVEPDGSLTEAGGDIDCVMRIYTARVSDHIDIVARAV